VPQRADFCDRTTAVIGLALVTLVASSSSTAADIDYVNAAYVRGFNGMGVIEGGAISLGVGLEGPDWLRGPADALRSKVAVVGLRTGSTDTLSLASAGAEWQWNAQARGFETALRAGTGPAVLSEASIAGRRLGGRFHFMSHIALDIGHVSSRHWRLSAGLHHISNAGLQEHNPGLEIESLALWTYFRF